MPRLVKAGLAREENLARDGRPQRFQAAAGSGVRSVHCFLLSFAAPTWGYRRDTANLLTDGVSWRHACCVIRATAAECDSSRDKSPRRPAVTDPRRCPDRDHGIH